MPRDHWVPQFLLRMFTLSGGKADTFWRYTRDDEAFTETRPYDVCWMDSLYNLDEQTIQRALEAGRVIGPRGLEQDLSREVEDQSARAIRRMDRDGCPAKQKDLDWLVSFVAMQVIRTPYYMGQLVEHMASRPRHNDVLALALADQPRIFDGLQNRRWTLHRPAEGQGYFVTTDIPVQLMAEGGRNLDIVPESFALEDSIVSMPLSKTLMLVGRNCGPRDSSYLVDQHVVALMNRMTLSGLYLEVYSPEPEILVLHDDRAILVNGKSPRLPWRESSPSG